jgi:DNA repair exonuclease SbcCD ATPase subunit
LWTKRRSLSRTGHADDAPSDALRELEHTLQQIASGETAVDADPGFDPLSHALSLTRIAAAGVARQERRAERLAGSLRREARRQVVGLRTDLARVTSEANSSAGAVERLSQQLAEAHGALAELNRTVDKLRARGEELETQLAAERHAHTAQALEFDQLTGRLEEAERSAQLAQAELDEQREELERAQGRIMSLTAALPRSPLDDEFESAAAAGGDSEAPAPDADALPLDVPEPPQCSVCYRLPEHATGVQLAKQGWTISNGAWLCPDCERRGWRLPPARRLHRFRLGGA